MINQNFGKKILTKVDFYARRRGQKFRRSFFGKDLSEMELPPTIPELGRQLRSWARVRWLYPEELYLLLVYPANELGLEPRNFYAPSGIVFFTFVFFAAHQ